MKIFIKKYCQSSQPLLLALSGGPDSLCLFYALLVCRSEGMITFHVAHVDHGWRQESLDEALAIKKLTHQYQVPYHEKKILPTELAGNLENGCRQERLQFFKEDCEQHYLQGVVLGHQQGDQVETVLKRILEGSHWSRLEGIKECIWYDQIPFLRPLLRVEKKDILDFLKGLDVEAFDDITNRDERYMRARMREKIIPNLNREFGKNIEHSIVNLASEITEIKDFFLKRLNSLLGQLMKGPFGIYLNLSSQTLEIIEIKYLLRLLAEEGNFFLSRQIVDRAAEAIKKRENQRLFEMGSKKIIVDRGHVFVLLATLPVWNEIFTNSSSKVKNDRGWILTSNEVIFTDNLKMSDWLNGWQGHLKAYLPIDEYRLSQPFAQAKFRKENFTISKWWAKHHIPHFLRFLFPVVWSNNKIVHEFLTGCDRKDLKNGDKCLQIELNYSISK